MSFSIFMVAVGGALGSVARFLCSLALARWFGETFPWGTLFVNVIGSFIIGFYFLLTAPGGRLLVAPDWRLFVITGICGGFTTFSSFSLQTLLLLRDSEWRAASFNIFGSLVSCMFAVWLGALCANVLNSRP